LIPSHGRSDDAISDDEFNRTRFDNPALLAAADDLRNEQGPASRKKQKSEKMGEEGALVYLRAHTGYPDIGLRRMERGAVHTLPTTPGYRWPHAVAFRGSGVADISYWDGRRLHVIEAKGGGSAFGQRDQFYIHKAMTVQEWLAENPKVENDPGVLANVRNELDARTKKTGRTGFQAGDRVPFAARKSFPTKLTQGRRSYLTDIGYTMLNSKSKDNRRLIGKAIVEQGANVHYQAVSTQLTDSGGVTVQTKLK
jgi:hypothetical protein